VKGHQSLGRHPPWPRPFQEFDIAAISTTSFVIDLKSAREKLDFNLRASAVGVLKASANQGSSEFPAGVFLDLHAEGRHTLKVAMKPGRFLKHANHAPVVLDR